LKYDRDENAFEGDGGLASGLADSNFCFIPFSSTVVSGDWGGLSAAMLWDAASTTLKIPMQTEMIARFKFISFRLQSTLGGHHGKFLAELARALIGDRAINQLQRSDSAHN
jgi:hypothetical protein